MRNKRYNPIQATAVALALLLLSFLPACSDDDGGNGPDLPDNQLYTLTIHLQPSAPHTPVTKAEGDEQDNTYERRLEHWWLLVYGPDPETKQEGLIEVVSDETYTANPTGDDSETDVEVELPIGTYRLYALANLNSLKEENELIEEIKNKTITEEKLKEKSATLTELTDFNNEEVSSRKAIPMSSYATTTNVQGDKENKAEVALFRMLGKVRIDVTNQTGSGITLTSLSMGKFREGPIFLLPYGNGPDEGTEPNLPETVQFPQLTDDTKPVFSIHEIETNNTQLAQNATQPYTFYQYETAFTENQTTAHESFTISVKAGNKELKDYEIDFDYMRRNDFLTIPITISNIQTTLRWSGSRMPIGGLPIEKEYGNDDGIQVGTPFNCTVDHAGDVKVEYDLESITGITTGTLQLKYKPEEQFEEGQKYCEAILVDNTKETNQTEGLLIDTNDNSVLPDQAEITLTPDDSDDTKGSFTVRTQELGENSSAEIKLTLIAQYNDPNDPTQKREVEIPYTIIIQNYKNTSTTN
ncbi:hypothetical protein [Parabacteroides distasonis]|uniref:hypothetical protein n=1 Tax=Parabacteroides distasonis TaxID=823 RepID=UPI002164386C|nr:hypothetical protein [Parabacteroides distasonis]UVR97198.1 hypothetical protein NXX79_06735 [Parabacteroides distasonis]